MPLTSEQEKVWDKLKYQWQPGDPVIGDLDYDVESGNLYMWDGVQWQHVTSKSHQNFLKTKS